MKESALASRVGPATPVSNRDVPGTTEEAHLYMPDQDCPHACLSGIERVLAADHVFKAGVSWGRYLNSVSCPPDGQLCRAQVISWLHRADSSDVLQL